jgi:hypothetical protein
MTASLAHHLCAAFRAFNVPAALTSLVAYFVPAARADTIATRSRAGLVASALAFTSPATIPFTASFSDQQTIKHQYLLLLEV